MNNTNESIGLRVLDVSPNNRSSNVNVNSDIKITFTADINPQTFIKNIVVLKDYNHIFKDINSLKDYSQYSVVKGSISYKDRVLTFTPEEQFDTDTCYIVVLNDGITDITGIKMIKKHVSCFYTEAIASFPRCEIISPKYGCITDEVPIFQWKNQCSESYIFQISKSNTFELLLYNKVIDGNKITTTIEHKPDIKFEEGLYHIRVKSENGEWSDTHQIFIKPIVDAIVSSQDASEMMMFEDFFEGIEEPLEILEYFPPQDNINISLKTNVIYIKIKGKIDESKINLNDCYVYGDSFDEEHEEYAHKTVDGKWTVVYDSYYDVTYIIFIPDILDNKAENEYIETLHSGNINIK